MSLYVSRGKREFLVCALVALAASQVHSCGSETSTGPPVVEANAGASPMPDAGDSSAVGGAGNVSTGGATTGGVGTGGDSTGQAAAGGNSIGGAATGGASTGGASTGGAAAGGAATGGTSTGGAGTGGAGTGGASTGGSATGGAATGGTATGGTGTGGGSIGGAAGAAGQGTGGSAEGEVVGIVQSETDSWSLTTDQIRALVTEAVNLAGGFGFITDGQTVVLKPNLVSLNTADDFGNARRLDAEVNGVTTDWRVTLAVAELVRARNPSGRILVIEGSAIDTEDTFQGHGYTSSNFGSNVNEFIPLEGSSCDNPSTQWLVQAPAVNGQSYWVDERYLNAEVLISLPVLKTHWHAGITGAVKNLGIGATPVGAYGGNGCIRMYNEDDPRDDPIDHTREPLSQWIHDYYSVRPADFSIMDGLRGLAHGPDAGNIPGADYDTDLKNMRLILAARNAVALDTIAALVMHCDPAQVGHLTLLDASGLGPADPAEITVVGKRVDEVSLPLAGPDWACPSS